MCNFLHYMLKGATCKARLGEPALHLALLSTSYSWSRYLELIEIYLFSVPFLLGVPSQSELSPPEESLTRRRGWCV